MIEATIARDSQGFPSLVTLQDGAKRLEVAFDRDSGFTITGSRRSFTQELLDVLRMIYPATVDFKFHIPEPLQVVNVQGGTTILYDNMEDLLKWRQVGATVAADNTFAYNGGQSLQLTGAAGATAHAERYFPLSPLQKYKLSFMWAVDTYANLTAFDATVIWYDDVTYYGATIRLVGTTNTLQVSTVGGALLDVEAMPAYPAVVGVGGGWMKTELTFDFINRHYGKLKVNNRIWNLEDYELDHGVTAAAEAFGIVDLQANAEPASNVNVWIDDLLLEAVT